MEALRSLWFLRDRVQQMSRKSVQTRDGYGWGANFGFVLHRRGVQTQTVRSELALRGVHAQVHRSRPRLRVPLTGEVLTPGMTPGITYAGVGKEIATVL